MSSQPSASQPSAESRDEQLARNVSELLGELRVAQAAVQFLFGFLLTITFTDHFREANGFEKGMHLTAVLLAATSTALLAAPPVWHRMLFREGRREEILQLGNKSVLGGLVCLALAVTTTVALIAKVIFGSLTMALIGPVIGLLFGVLWFVVPHHIRRRHAGEPPAPTADGE
ncbi:DUF6328 family protein [Saccharothrix sp. AJ9571]|nr:DUF6328 family protein [Saccharothrix sp. AJ9571]